MTHQPRILALFGSAALFGQERGNIEVLKSLQEQGGTVLCLIRGESWSIQVPSALDTAGLVSKKVPYIYQPLPGRLHFVLFRNAIVFLRSNWLFFQIYREFQPTHIHAFNPLYVLNFLIGLCFVRIPMVYRAGDEPTVHNWFWRLLWKFIIWRTSRFVANSQFIEHSLRRSGAPPDRIMVIYNAPPRRFGANGPPITFPNECKEGRITYIGQISPHKGVDLLVYAFRHLANEFPNARLMIAGRISDWSGDAWARQLREVTASDPIIGCRVSFLGEVHNVHELLFYSSFHVVPSLFDDPSPNVIMEAKLASCPSVVFPCGGIPELVRDGIDGFICREVSKEGLIEQLRVYLQNPSLARQHGAAARESLARLGIPNFKYDWLQAYKKSN